MFGSVIIPRKLHRIGSYVMPYGTKWAQLARARSAKATGRQGPRTPFPPPHPIPAPYLLGEGDEDLGAAAAVAGVAVEARRCRPEPPQVQVLLVGGIGGRGGPGEGCPEEPPPPTLSTTQEVPSQPVAQARERVRLVPKWVVAQPPNPPLPAFITLLGGGEGAESPSRGGCEPIRR